MKITYHFRNEINAFIVWLRKKLTFAYRVFAYLLIAIGHNMLHTKKQHSLISSIIQSTIINPNSQITVTDTSEEKLYVRFLVLITPRGRIDERYFTSELALQLGCATSDIAISEDKDINYVDIAKTAIYKFEQGNSDNMPKAFITKEKAKERSRQTSVN